ncbi:neuronal acetylcholine receptor subunit alpha-7 [Drosophila biarmipes]|uniref:neuronal acetylcholine receptor subunit alpha-7 n=1 Tax=Drosophila biarmipes TaxID=125945 RepID=UPI0007E6A0CA|nr:neuronal acetylcholine receptor subunit alpha-7 [Drosophila biarmipes]XP_043950480.1 neuronal acetylcholine receptor subunit alpha-7 [Drosophila biarmipes]XP_043950481.1 neuronal acetylcholine receptor subunit alpha-7 [Drosophila biarmipes]XP_043950482.1 neuronal acetylcholine receptor subunit alpha-7 [Drosophila biarmipes]
MKNAQLKLTEVDDDELWLAVRLAHCGSSNSSSGSRSNSSNRRQHQQLSQLQQRSLSTKHHSIIANKQHNSPEQKPAQRAEDVASYDQQQQQQQQQQQLLDSNMLSPFGFAAAAIAAGDRATTQQPTNIRLCARKRQRLRRRRKRKPATLKEAAAATTSNSSSHSSSSTSISNINLPPTATYMQCRTSEKDTSTAIASRDEATFTLVLQVLQVLLVTLQQWQLHVQQRAAVLFRGIAISTTAFISYLGSFAAQLRSSSSNSNSNSSSSSSTQIINGLNKHSWIFLLIYLNLSAKVCLAGYHEKRLLHDLLDPYNTLERPVLNESDPLQLSFGLTLMQIIDVDEKNQLLVTNVWLKLEWNDMNLRWNTSDYGGVKDLRIPPHRIWKPDVLMYNSADEGFDGTYQTNVVVRNNGSCLYVPPGIFKSTCKIDITWFPFDDQRCEMKFGSWTYDGFQLDLQLQDETGGDISSYVLNGEWELLGVPGKRNEIYYNCCPEPYIDITFAIIIRRRTLYYFFNLIIPCVLIASMALLGFTLPPDSGEKLSLGVTILLSLTVFLNMVAETMPATSDAVPLLGTYFNCIMFMVASSVVSTILILNYHHRNADTHEMSEWIRIVFLCWLPWILRMSRPGRPLILEFPTTPCSDTSSERKHQILSDVELKERSSKSLLANVLDIDDDFRHNCRPMTPGGTLPHNPAFYRTVYGQGDDGSIGPIGSTRMPDAVTHHTCIKSSTEYELGLILKEIRFITDQLRKDDECNDIANDWKFAAMVVDRLCLIIFTMFTILATIAVLLSAPHIIVS